MRKIKILIFTLALGLSVIAVAQPGVIGSVANTLSNLFNFNQSTTGNNQNTGGITSYSYPFTQTTNKPTFNSTLEQQQLQTTLTALDNGKTLSANASTATLTPGMYYDFETGQSSNTTFAGADMYYSPSGQACPITPTGSSIASDLGSVSFSSVDYSHYGNYQYPSRPCSNSPITFLFDDVHGNSGYGIFYNLTKFLGYNTEVLQTGSITSDTLAHVNVLVIYDPTASYSTAEVNAIGNFVHNGGNLISFNNESNAGNAFLQQFGYKYNQGYMFNTVISYWDGSPDFSISDTNTIIQNNPLSAGLKRVVIPDCGYLDVPSGSQTIIKADYKGSFIDAYTQQPYYNSPVMSALDYSGSQGRIFVSSSGNLFQNTSSETLFQKTTYDYYLLYSNSQLAVNIINWSAASTRLATVPSGNAGITFLFDNSHVPVDNISDSGFLNLVNSLGYNTEVLQTGPITSDTLANANVLVITAPKATYSTDEINAIGQFVDNGGNLILFNQYDGTPGNSVVQQFGYSLSQPTNLISYNYAYLGHDNIPTFSGSATILQNTPLTSGVQEVVTVNPGYINSVPAGSQTILHTDYLPFNYYYDGNVLGSSYVPYYPIMNALEANANHGRVFVSADAKFLNPGYLTAFNNTQLATNIINWSAGSIRTSISKGDVLLFNTSAGNQVRAQFSYSGLNLTLTYDNLYYISINGDQNLNQTAIENGWSGTGIVNNPYIITGYDLSTYHNIGAFSITNTDLFVKIVDNTFNGLGSTENGLFFSNDQNIEVNRNTITGYTHGVLEANSNNINFDSNTITGMTDQGMLISSSANNQIQNNQIADNSLSGITVVSLSSSINILHNTIQYNALLELEIPTISSSGVSYAQSYGTIANNIVSNNEGNGVLVVGSGVILNSNALTNDLTPQPTNNEHPPNPNDILLANDVENNALDGITVISSNAINVGLNTANMNQGSGISVLSTMYVNATNDNANQNGENGITWDNSWYGEIVGNTFTGNNLVKQTIAKPNSLTAYSYGSGVFMDPSSYNIVEGNTIANNGHGIYIQGSSYNNFTSNQVNDNGLNGVSLIDSSVNLVQQNTISGNSNPTTLALSMANSKVSGLSAYSYGSGVFMDPSYNNTVSDNTIDGNYGYGFSVYTSSANTFDNNNVAGNGLDGGYIINSDNNTISNSRFVNNSNPALQVQLLSAFKPSSVSAYSYGSGVFMDPSNFNTITNNVFDSNYGDGMDLLSSTYNILKSNHMTNNALNGLTVKESSSNNILSNTLTGNGNVTLQVAFLSYGKPVGITAYSYGSGVFMDPSTNNNFIGNTINNNYGYGSWVQASTNNVIDSNSVTGNALDGVFIDNSNYNNVTNNVISANSNAVLQSVAQQVANAFKPGSITAYSYGSGVFMDPSVGNYVAGNTISNNPFNGVLLQESNSNVFDSNNITNSGQNGFELDNSSYNNVTSNTVSGSGNTAVLNSFLSYGKPAAFTAYSYGSGVFMDPSIGNYLAFNTITNTNGYGVHSKDSNGNNLYSNIISKNSQYGYLSENSNNNGLSKNSFISNTLYGTFFDSNSHQNNVANNNYVENSLGTNNKQGYDDGGNSYSGNFFLDENPNTPYLLDGTSGTKDSSVSVSPSINLGFLHLAPVQVKAFFFTHSLNVRSEGEDLMVWVYFPTGYSSYLVNKSSVYIEWNGNSYPVERVNTFSSHWLLVKFDRQQLSRDLNHYLVDNKLESTMITLTAHGSFNGGFLQFYGSNQIKIFNQGYHDDFQHNRGRN